MSSTTRRLLKLKLHVRWLISIDMPVVLQIERDSFADGWTDEDFRRLLRQRNCIGMVAEHGEKVIGFMVYTIDRRARQGGSTMEV